MKIGIPRSLFYYKHPHLWLTFFQELGQEVVLSPPTNRTILDTAVRYGEDESCLAVKLVFGHISYLLGKCDAIFAPAYYGLQPDRYSCPKFLGVPDIAKSIFSEEIKFLRCEVDDGEFEPGMQQLARTFTRDRLSMKRAISRALESRTEHKRRLHATYREQLASEKPKILVVGHSYVIHDSYANLNLLAKLEERDVEVITIDRVPPAPRESFLKWDFAYETMGQLQEVLTRDIVGVIVLSNFNCGVDAITVPFVEHEVEQYDIPCMHLILDEHTGDAGIITRVDTFVDTSEDEEAGVRERIFTLPLCGNSWIPFKGAAEQLGARIVVPPPITNETIALGARYSPEGICLPFKVIIGNYLQTLDQGANAVIFYVNNRAGSKNHGGGGGGMCRFRHYGHLQQLVMNRIGADVEFFILGEGGGLIEQIREMTGGGTWEIIRALRVAIKKLRVIEITEELSWRYRAVEKHRGATSTALKALEGMQGFKELDRLNPESFFSHVETVDREPLRIGVVGEFYLLVEPASNCHIFEMLGELGAEVHRHLSLGEAILRYPPGFVLGKLMAWWLNMSIPPRSETAQIAKPYLSCSVAGHGRESVADTIRFCREGYDGVLHLLPMGCMPEVTVRPILRKISEDYNFPVLTLSFDEVISEGAIRTRIETFVDIIRLRKERGYGRDALPRR